MRANATDAVFEGEATIALCIFPMRNQGSFTALKGYLESTMVLFESFRFVSESPG
jgi:hypothetical protein